MGVYKGPSGSIRSLAAHHSGDYLVAVGLDRHATVFNTNKRRTAKTLCKVYLKQKLNCVLMSSDVYAPPAADHDDAQDESERESQNENEGPLHVSDETGSEDEAPLDESGEGSEDENDESADDSHLILEDESEEEHSDHEVDDTPQAKRIRR